MARVQHKLMQLIHISINFQLSDFQLIVFPCIPVVLDRQTCKYNHIYASSLPPLPLIPCVLIYLNPSLIIITLSCMRQLNKQIYKLGNTFQTNLIRNSSFFTI